jgi:hypothetical protein
LASIINASNSGFGGIVSTGDSSGQLQLQTAGTTAVTIDTSQNVGIGTASPASALDVQATSGVSMFRLTATTGTNAVYSRYSNTGGFLYLGRDNSSGTDFGSAYAAGIWSTGAYPMLFGTNGTERMRIDSSGNVNIGQSSAFGAGIRTTIKAADSSSQSLALVSAVTSGTGTLQYLVDGSNDVCGYIGINATANTTSYNTSSDYRLKENIIPMTGALDKVSKLKPVLWNWKHAPEVIGQGFIAHELAEVIPDAVSGEKDAVDDEGKPVYQGIDTSFLVATLTAAIQEQQTIINDLKARVETLEAN